MNILSIRNISKTYCGNIPFKALDKVSLNIEKENLCLLWDHLEVVNLLF